MTKISGFTRLAIVALAVAGGLTACAQNMSFVRVKTLGSTQICAVGATCEVVVAMALKDGRCVYDLPEAVFVPKEVNDVRWVLKPATGEPLFRFAKGRPPVVQKPGDGGPPFAGKDLPAPADSYSVVRDAKRPAGVTSYKMSVEFIERRGVPAAACADLDPLIVSMP